MAGRRGRWEGRDDGGDEGVQGYREARRREEDGGNERRVLRSRRREPGRRKPGDGGTVVLGRTQYGGKGAMGNGQGDVQSRQEETELLGTL